MTVTVDLSSEDVWRRYNDLVAKRRAGDLSPDEHAELVGLSDQVEEANARRVGRLVELARLRGISPSALLSDLGITTHPFQGGPKRAQL